MEAAKKPRAHRESQSELARNSRGLHELTSSPITPLTILQSGESAAEFAIHYMLHACQTRIQKKRKAHEARKILIVLKSKQEQDEDKKPKEENPSENSPEQHQETDPWVQQNTRLTSAPLVEAWDINVPPLERV